MGSWRRCGARRSNSVKKGRKVFFFIKKNQKISSYDTGVVQPPVLRAGQAEQFGQHRLGVLAQARGRGSAAPGRPRRSPAARRSPGCGRRRAGRSRRTAGWRASSADPRAPTGRNPGTGPTARRCRRTRRGSRPACGAANHGSSTAAMAGRASKRPPSVSRSTCIIGPIIASCGARPVALPIARHWRLEIAAEHRMPPVRGREVAAERAVQIVAERRAHRAVDLHVGDVAEVARPSRASRPTAPASPPAPARCAAARARRPAARWPGTARPRRPRPAARG